MEDNAKIKKKKFNIKNYFYNLEDEKSISALSDVLSPALGSGQFGMY